MNFRPLNGNVLIKRMPTKTQTSGGIALPDQAQKPPTRGTVEAVAFDLIDNTSIYPGAVVLFAPYTEDIIWIDGAEYLVIKADKLLGCLPDAP